SEPQSAIIRLHYSNYNKLLVTSSEAAFRFRTIKDQMLSADVVVIGAGSFGAWSALSLQRAGNSVLLIDAWGPGHSRSSSGAESRIIRMGYGADEIYTRMAKRSLELWQDLFRQTGHSLFYRTGVLWLGRVDDPYSESTRQTLGAAGVPFEILPA